MKASSNKCRRSLCVIATAFLLLTGNAENRQASLVDPYQAGSQYLAYPRPDYGLPTLSDAPEGYAPFHIEHYGRHGSRWLLNNDKYDEPVEQLELADKYGKLTPRGKELLEQLKEIRTASKGRVGELTPLGHRQHRGIGRRMVANFPEVFTPGTHVDAKSTVVIRCILSMANEIAEMQTLCPELIITCDASRTTQKILAYNSTDTVAKKLGRAAEKKYGKEYAKSLPKPEAFFNKIFTDRKFVTDSLDDMEVFHNIFDVAVNTQSHDNQKSMYDIFTPEELHNEWLANNADWYLSAGNTPLTKNRVPYNQRVLLRNIIESADTAMISPRQSVNLRFGHESILLPLSVLMELNNAAYETTDLTTLADNWRNYEIFPMGSNIQMIFYRPENDKTISPDNVLVKVLLNEAEASLPIVPVQGSYYRWNDLRQYYMKKLDAFPSLFNE